jgi:biotin carboxyl carrier protein
MSGGSWRLVVGQEGGRLVRRWWAEDGRCVAPGQSPQAQPLTAPPHGPGPASAKLLASPMAGRVVDLALAQDGALHLTLEGMKLRMPIVAEAPGPWLPLVALGAEVKAGQTLARLQPPTEVQAPPGGP